MYPTPVLALSRKLEALPGEYLFSAEVSCQLAGRLAQVEQHSGDTGLSGGDVKGPSGATLSMHGRGLTAQTLAESPGGSLAGVHDILLRTHTMQHRGPEVR